MAAKNQGLRKVTISDVATLAQVSEATVSRVLNNNPTVSRSNQEAVLAAADQLGYSPRKKSSLSSAITSMTMCLGTDGTAENRMLAGDYFLPIIESVQVECRQRGINLLLLKMGMQGDDLQEVQRVIHEGLTDSLLLVHILDPALIEAILKLNVPSVLLNSYFPWLPIDSLNADSFSGTLVAMQHLLDNGHRQIAFIDGHENSQDYWVRMRHVAYQLKLTQAGIAYNPDLVAFGSLCRTGGERAMQQLLESGQMFSAVLCCNDQSAFGVMRALQNAGLTIPNDISVVGHDDVSSATLVTPALTTVQVPKDDLGSMSIQLLADRAENPHRPSQHLLLPECLVVRDSTRNFDGGALCPVNSKIIP